MLVRHGPDIVLLHRCIHDTSPLLLPLNYCSCHQSFLSTVAVDVVTNAHGGWTWPSAGGEGFDRPRSRITMVLSRQTPMKGTQDVKTALEASMYAERRILTCSSVKRERSGTTYTDKEMSTAGPVVVVVALDKSREYRR